MNRRLLTKTSLGLVEPDRPNLPPKPVRTPSMRLEAPSWLISLCLHVSVFLILAVGLRPYFRGTSGEETRVIGVAFVQEVSEGDENGASVGGKSDAPEGGGSSSPIGPVRSAPGNGPPLDPIAILSELTGSSTNSTPNAEALGGSGNAIGPGRGGGQKGGKKGGKLSEVNFYDMAGVGNSFVYVIDRSDSMNEHNKAPLRAAKREVTKSLEGIQETSRFQIIFYNNQPFPFQSKLAGGRGLIRAQEIERRSAIEFVANVSAFGGTEHLSALKLGISMNPDVLFFLTDAEQPRLSVEEMELLVARCEGNTTIHAIEFGNSASPVAGRWIEALAERTGGKYRYVDVTQLQK